MSAAASPLKSASDPATAGQGWTLKAGHVNDRGQNVPVSPVGTVQFSPSQPSPVKFIKSPTPFNADSILAHDRGIPGKLAASGGKVPNAAAAPNATLTPSANSIPIVPGSYLARAKALNAYDQDSIGGYTVTPPDQALAEGGGYVLEAVNNVLQVYNNTTFGVVPATEESMETFWAFDLSQTGFCSLADPKAHYDPVRSRWYVTEAAYGPPGGSCASGFGSAVFVAVSTTANPAGPYTETWINTSLDGTHCSGDGCLGDQPLLGMDRNALFISTNSYDWDTPAFNGAQLYVLDPASLAVVVHFDIGQHVPTPDGNGCGLANSYPADAYCWYTVQPATSPNSNTFTNDRGGTEFFTSALDWLGSVDNRVAVWAITNTSSITGSPNLYLNYAIAKTEAYGFPFTDTPFFSPYAQQPGSGNTPLCDFFVGPFCEPGPIANNDDRMNELESYKPPVGATHLWSGMNTDALVADPLGGLHRRSAIAYFDTKPTAWFGQYILAAGVNGQGYVANWANDVIFPAIGVGNTLLYNGTRSAMVFTLTGNNNLPSVAVAHLRDGPSQPLNIGVVLAGQDVLDDFAWYFFGSPRWGDYSAAVGDGATAYLATEYIQKPSCDDATYSSDPTCLGTRSEFTNWGTGLARVNI